MVLSQPDLRKEVEEGRIRFNPQLEENQWGQASVDLRLGFTFTRLKEIPGMTISLSRGVDVLGSRGFWNDITLDKFDAMGERESFVLKPRMFILAMRK